MTRKEAKETIYHVINSGIIDEELEESLIEICKCICNDMFDKCKRDIPNYCEGCPHLKE